MKKKEANWKRKRYKIIRLILIITLGVIWGQSLIPRSYSQLESDIILSVITPFDIDIGNINTDKYWCISNVVRKLAHIIEYAVLGMEMCFFTFFRIAIKQDDIFLDSVKSVPTDGKISILFLILIGMLVGLVDETIQVFSHRGSMILDVWIDSLGAMIGVCIGSKMIPRIFLIDSWSKLMENKQRLEEKK